MGSEGRGAVLEPLWRGLPAPGTETLSGSATCALPTRYEAVGNAREFTRRTLRRWERLQEFDDVTLVVSELVTNALQHGLRGRTRPEDDDSEVRLHLMRWSARLVCAVRDPSGEAPRVPPAENHLSGAGAWLAGPDVTAESGRGLCLVESFSDCWGWHRLTGSLPGKVVWAMFRPGPE